MTSLVDVMHSYAIKNYINIFVNEMMFIHFCLFKYEINYDVNEMMLMK